jgi:hypothetical protein
VLGVLLLYGATALGWNGVYLAAVARLAGPAQAGMATGGTLAFTYFGVVVTPPLFGLVANWRADFGLAYALSAVPLALCLGAMLRAWPPEGRTARSTGP